MRFSLQATIRHAARFALAIAALSCVAEATPAVQQVEQSVKAAFIFNFAKYVVWPASTFENDSSPIIVGIVGRDSLGGALEFAVEGKTAGGRSILVRHFKWGQDLAECQILFVSEGEMGGAAALAKLKSKPVLTVGESEGFAANFGIINLVVVAGRVRFQINADSARRAGLTISSRLRSLALPPN